MPEFNWQAGWDFLGVILAIIFGCFAVATWWFSRTRKELKWRVLAQTPLLTIEDTIKGKVKILLDDKQVQNLHRVILEILNAGKQPITEADFIRPITIGFGEQAEIISYRCISTPQDLGWEWQITGNEITLKPLLLNPRDMVILSVLINGWEKVIIQGRIIGVSKIEAMPGNQFDWFDWFGLIVIAGLFLAGALFVIAFWLTNIYIFWISIFLIVLGMPVGFLYVIVDLYRRKRRASEERVRMQQLEQ